MTIACKTVELFTFFFNDQLNVTILQYIGCLTGAWCASPGRSWGITGWDPRGRYSFFSSECCHGWWGYINQSLSDNEQVTCSRLVDFACAQLYTTQLISWIRNWLDHRIISMLTWFAIMSCYIKQSYCVRKKGEVLMWKLLLLQHKPLVSSLKLTTFSFTVLRSITVSIIPVYAMQQPVYLKWWLEDTIFLSYPITKTNNHYLWIVCRRQLNTFVVHTSFITAV